MNNIKLVKISQAFVHLRNHSCYSLLESALSIKKIIDLTIQNHSPAVALTDSGNLFGALEFSEKAIKSFIQPIIAVTLNVKLDNGTYAPSYTYSQYNKSIPSIALFVQNKKGYKNLMTLVSKSFFNVSNNETPYVSLDMLKKHTSGLIALSGGPAGPINKELYENNNDRAKKLFNILKELYQNSFYIELQRHKLYEENKVENQLIKLAYDNNIPLVGTNQNFFHKQKDYKSHDALICISQSTVICNNNRLRVSPEHYFKSSKEMIQLFKDLPEAIENTLIISKKCSFRLRTYKPILPNFIGNTTKDILKIESNELTKIAKIGLKKRLDSLGICNNFTEKDYFDRLNHELKIINNMKFPGYFLIVSDFIKWAKNQNIPVGPGRGSGAGSLVAYSLTITDLDPIKWGLLFERFLNPERISMPDFDIDFCQNQREKVIKYVQNKYGFSQVAQIITFGKLQARAVLRDVGRVLQIPYSQVDKLCKLIPNLPNNMMTLSEALIFEPKLRKECKNQKIIAELLEISQKLEGLYRHASTHAAGLVIGDRPLDQLIPLYRDPKSNMLVTQFNMKWVELTGLVKFDFLGLKTLTVISTTLKYLKNRNIHINLSSISINDKLSYELMSSGQTIGVFQLESKGMRDMLQGLKPDRFEDIIALVALYRPGPMSNIPIYISCKHGKKKPNYLHPKLKNILKETYGVIIYQEQVMQIAQILSNYSLGNADLLRRAMSKKNKKEMHKQRMIFNQGAIANGVEADKADYIFNLVNKFAGYGFNKSHAAAYALITYQTAYLKANYPVEFMASLMTLDINNIEKLQTIKQECIRMGIKILPPDINKSNVNFLVENNNIRYSLAALKNIGTQAVNSIIKSRNKVGMFKNIIHFSENLNTNYINKRSLENMIKAGVFDKLNSNRAQLFNGISSIISFATKNKSDKLLGIIDIFTSVNNTNLIAEKLPLPKTKHWTNTETLEFEKIAIGFYISGHPLDDYKTLLKQMKVITWEQFCKKKFPINKKNIYLVAIITSIQKKISKKGNKFYFIGLSDVDSEYKAIIFDNVYKQYKHYLMPETLAIINVTINFNVNQINPIINSVELLNNQMNKFLKKNLKIYLDGKDAINYIKQLLQIGGEGKVFLIIASENKQFKIEILLKEKYILSLDTIAAIKSLPQVKNIIQS